MQADHHVLCVTITHDVCQTIQLLSLQEPERFIGLAAIEAHEQPVAHLFICAVRKRWHTTNAPHQRPHVVIARHAVHTKIQRQHQFSKPIVRLRRIILDQIAGDNDAIGNPVACLVVVENPLQRCLRLGTAQGPVSSSEQMRIRKVQDSNQFAVRGVRVRSDRKNP